MSEMINIETIDFDEMKRKAVSLLTDIACRIAWNIFSKSLLDNSTIKAKGYNKLIDKLSSLSDNLSSRLILANILKLSESLVEHYLSSEKAVRIFKLDDRIDKIKLTNTLTSINPDQKYNGLLNVEKKEFSENPTLIFKKTNGLGYYFGYASNRLVKLKQEIPFDALTEEYSKEVPVGADMYIIKMDDKFCFDVIFIPVEMDRIEFRIDTTEGLTHEYRSIAYSQLSSLFFTESRTHGFNFNGRLLDFYPAIKKVLEFPVEDGRVVELKFTTDEGAMKHHKNRRGNRSILTDKYHLAGAQVINDQFDPYYISRVWANPTTGAEPELILPGTMRANSSYGTNNLDEAIITKTLNENDYRFIVGKLMSIINALPPKGKGG